MSGSSARRKSQPARRSATKRVAAADAECPCGSGKSYADCCGAIHEGRAKAATAEQLMRSRYSAFAVGDPGYLLKSWHSTTRPASLDLDPGLRWTGLEIRSVTAGSPFHTEGTVAFEARYVDHGQPGILAEDSSFVRENGDWVYLSPRA